jgi:hypothetical protein
MGVKCLEIFPLWLFTIIPKLIDTGANMWKYTQKIDKQTNSSLSTERFIACLFVVMGVWTYSRGQ